MEPAHSKNQEAVSLVIGVRMIGQAATRVEGRETEKRQQLFQSEIGDWKGDQQGGNRSGCSFWFALFFELPWFLQRSRSFHNTFERGA